MSSRIGLRLPDESPRTLGALFQAAVRESGPTEFLRTVDCSLSFAEASAWSAAVAGGLVRCGVKKGDRVVVACGNRPEVAVTWLACLRMGACFAPIHPETSLVHLPSLLGALSPSALVAEGARSLEFGRCVTDAGLATTVIALSERAPCATPWNVVESAEPLQRWETADESDCAAIICTSGTTGPSKGVVLSHRWFTKICETTAENWRFSSSDRFYCPLPLHHMDGLAMTLVPAIYHRTTAAVGKRFSVRRFWDEVREFEATVFDFLGSTLTMLWKQPPCPDDADNPARLGWGVPLPAFQAAFEERFNCQLVDCYGSTDIGIPVYGRLGDDKPVGSCGRVVEGYEVAILDDEGKRVGADVVGEIAVRTSEPHIIMEGYVGQDDATLRTWRGLWHHTGDLGRIDDAGYVYFEGRSTDSIRRRGENISAQELEAIVLGHHAVLDAVAIGVPSELTEEDVKVVAALRDGQVLRACDLADWLAGAVPSYMRVRYVELVEHLPLTDTGKVIKSVLRAEWRTASTWDCESSSFLADAVRGAGTRTQEDEA
jgi:crotonobetaine/carnitine-CoA ligase